MVNYACAFSQSELGKYFEWIIMVFNSLQSDFSFMCYRYTSRMCYTSRMKEFAFVSPQEYPRDLLARGGIRDFGPLLVCWV